MLNRSVGTYRHTPNTTSSGLNSLKMCRSDNFHSEKHETEVHSIVFAPC